MSENILSCPLCGFNFHFGPSLYEGKHLKGYELTVCRTCYNSNRDGWNEDYEDTLLEVLEENSTAKPERLDNDLLPREF